MHSCVIAVDVMGGDNAPNCVLSGVESVLKKRPDISLLLCGLDKVVTPFAQKYSNCSAVACSEVIDMGEPGSRAIRKKKDSSLVQAAQLVSQGKAQGFFSAGSTGACLAASTLIIGRIKGIKRPALAIIIPTKTKPVVLTDVGANSDCKPEYFPQFAIMGKLYSEIALGTKNPSCALLNIGTEKEKGSHDAQLAYELMEQVPGFLGNTEANQIFSACHDVIVTDGFTGNVCLKTIEGVAKQLFSSIKEVSMSSLSTKIGALLLKSGLLKLKDSLNADCYGGAPLLGVNGSVVVGHGSSSSFAIENGILFTAELIQGNIVQRISDEITVLRD